MRMDVTATAAPKNLCLGESPEPATTGTGRVAGFGEPARDWGPKAPGAGGGDGIDLAAAADAFVGRPLAEVERRVIEATIRACGGSLAKAARVLGVSPSTLYRKRAGWTDEGIAKPDTSG